ncbi:endo-1,4-beta-xylanase [Teredinibacter turnerae]|uniref:endo-1,4-beta-xylanase n=1 Tax=Teredinibacter turnerae TaxID=2426 RepID=UPI000419D801|nr:endo-1,4-beta-xylanase [Teredinibacter turnerae]
MRFRTKRLGLAMLALGVFPSAAMATSDFSLESLFPGFSRPAPGQVETLADAAERSRRLVGVAAGYGLVTNDEQFVDIVTGEFNYMTPENSGKWGPLQPAPGEWNFDTHDQMVEFAGQSELAYKGHALVWHSQAPGFVTDDLSADELQSLIDDHITTVMSRYSGEIRAYDVVNEAMGDDAEYRDSVLYRTLGADFIANAFHTAHSVDRRAVLFYNDYNIAGLNAKSDAVYEMVQGLVNNRVPIDGVGFQMHLTAATAPSYDELVANLSRFANLGLRVNISELDVRVADLPWDYQTNIAIQRQVYHRVVSACMAVRRCEAVTTWGVSDKNSWINYTFGEDAALAWDDDNQRKPAYYGMLDGFMGVEPDENPLPNLIANSEFEGGVQGWTGENADVHRIRALGKGQANSMLVIGRDSREAGARYDFSDVALAGQSYDISSQVKIPQLSLVPLLSRLFGFARGDTVEMNVRTLCSDGTEELTNLETAFATFGRWQTIGGTVTLPNCEIEAVDLLVNGPRPGTSILVDSVVARPQVLVPTAEGFSENLVTNPYFEDGAYDWFGFGSAVVETTTDNVKSGVQSGYVTGRTDSWQGPATNVTAGVQAGDIYDMFAWVQADSADSRIGATLKVSCAGEDDAYLNIGNVNVAAGEWALLRGSVLVPDCELLDATLYFEGPAADVNMLIDEVYLRRDNKASDALDIVDDGNLHPNGGFELGTESWTTWGGALGTSDEYVRSGAAAGVLSSRTASWQGPVFDLLSVASAGGDYEITAWGMVQGVSQDTLNITVKTTCGGEAAYHQLASALVNNTEWTELSGTITLPSDCDLTEATLYFDGPAVGVDTYLDDVFISGEAPSVPNLVINGDFEAGINDWQVWGGVLSVSEDAHTGAQSALHSGRTADWQGPVYPLSVVADADYNVSAFIKIDGAASATATITLKTTCADGSEEYLWGGQAEVNSSGWTELSGVVTTTSCEPMDAVVYFAGPAAGIDILLDDVVVWQEGAVVEPPVGNLVANSSFEESLDGWISWGGTLERSADQAYDGAYSAYLTARTGDWEGPVYSLLSSVTAGSSYDIAAFARVDAGSAEAMNITVKVACDDGSEEYIWAGSAEVNDSDWTEVAGSVTLPACNLTEVSMYFGGPAQAAGIYLDQVSVVAL